MDDLHKESPDRVAQAAFVREQLEASQNPLDMSPEALAVLADLEADRDFRIGLSDYDPAPVERVLEWILHPDAAVRGMAVRFFNDSRSADERVMPQVIRALRQYGQSSDFRWHLHFEFLAQTAETIDWLIRQLLYSRQETGTCEKALIRADVVLLQSCAAEIVRLLKEVGSENVSLLEHRLRFAEQDFASLWRQLLAFTEKNRNVGDLSRIDLRHGSVLVEALARFPEQAVGEAREILNRPPVHEGAEELLRAFAIELAGELRRDELVPLIARELTSESDWFCEHAESALIRIGSDAAVDAVYHLTLRHGDDFGIRSGYILEKIHTSRSVATARSLQETTNDASVRTQLASAMLQSFAPIAVEIAQNMLRAGNWDPGLLKLDEDLIAVATALDREVDDPAAWPKVRTDMTDLFDEIRALGAAIGLTPAGLEAPLRRDEADSEVPRPAAETVLRRHPKIGRNDPCPCGSGRKYKKCCMKREQPQS